MTARAGEGETTRRNCDAGSATPVVAAVLALACVMAVAITAWGGEIGRFAQARGAADLAALAAAHVDRQHRALGAGHSAALVAACGAATDVAAANGADVVSCRRGPEHSVIVTVRVAGPRGLANVTATARAGPAMP